MRASRSAAALIHQLHSTDHQVGPVKCNEVLVHADTTVARRMAPSTGPCRSVERSDVASERAAAAHALPAHRCPTHSFIPSYSEDPEGFRHRRQGRESSTPTSDARRALCDPSALAADSRASRTCLFLDGVQCVGELLARPLRPRPLTRPRSCSLLTRSSVVLDLLPKFVHENYSSLYRLR